MTVNLLGTGTGRNHACQGYTLLAIHGKHEAKDFCAAEMQERKVNIGKALMDFAQVFVQQRIAGNVGGKRGMIAIRGLELQHTAHDLRHQQIERNRGVTCLA